MKEFCHMKQGVADWAVRVKLTWSKARFWSCANKEHWIDSSGENSRNAVFTKCSASCLCVACQMGGLTTAAGCGSFVANLLGFLLQIPASAANSIFSNCFHLTNFARTKPSLKPLPCSRGRGNERVLPHETRCRRLSSPGQTHLV